MTFAFFCILTVICAYLIGSVNFAVIFSRLFLRRDIRDCGSGNAGSTNVMRTAGVLPGIITFLCDVLKGFAACEIGITVFKIIGPPNGFQPLYGAFACGVACMLGHIFPVFFQFKGGKGVAISVGVFAVCCPILVPISLSVFTVTVLITKTVSLSSLVATVSVGAGIFFFADNSISLWPQAVMTLIMCVLVYAKHTENIKRLINGTEKKMSFGRKKQ